MNGIIPHRITFDDPETPQRLAQSAPFLDTPRSEQLYRLIPPSERTDLPSNIFVSSVDVGTGKMPKRNKKRKQLQEESEDLGAYEEDMQVEESEATEAMLLGEGPEPESDKNSGEVDELWGMTDEQWFALPEIKTQDQIRVGSLYGWKVASFRQ